MNPKIKIVLKPDYTRQDGTKNIRLRLTINRKVKYYPLNIYVKPKYFSNGRVLRGDQAHWNKNILIEKYFNKANNILFEQRINDIPTTFDSFERGFKNKLYGNQSFYVFAEKETRLSKERLAPATIVSFKNQIMKLKSFKKELTFNDIDKTFIDQYELYLIKERKNNKSTILKTMKFLKNFLNRAKAEGFIKENIFDNISLGNIEGFREFLTGEELNLLDQLYYKNDLKPNFNNVLRYFLFCCYTGLRYSDVKNLRFKDIQRDSYISVNMVKTKENVLIPLTQKAKNLLPAQGFKEQKVFRVLTDQPTNRYLKKIMQVANIDKSISFHCSRHTFATVSKSLGIEYDVISKILGHADLKTTRIYVKYEKSHLEKEMKKWDK